MSCSWYTSSKSVIRIVKSEVTLNSVSAWSRCTSPHRGRIQTFFTSKNSYTEISLSLLVASCISSWSWYLHGSPLISMIKSLSWTRNNGSTRGPKLRTHAESQLIICCVCGIVGAGTREFLGRVNEHGGVACIGSQWELRASFLDVARIDWVVAWTWHTSFTLRVFL